MGERAHRDTFCCRDSTGPKTKKPLGFEGHKAGMSSKWPVFKVTFHRLPKYPKHRALTGTTPCYAMRLVKAVSGVTKSHVSGSQEFGHLGLFWTSTGHKFLSGSLCLAFGVRRSPPANETRIIACSASTQPCSSPLSHDERFAFRWPFDGGVGLGRFAPTVAHLLPPNVSRFGG